MTGFVNPYNFISFPKHKAKAYTDTDMHTGVIEYAITTKTPLFIPNASTDCAFTESDQIEGHKSYDFFSYEELDLEKHYEGIFQIPVIPGSEIRGSVKNVYETLTDSCMGVLNEEKYPAKRTAEQFNPALIHKKKDGTIELCAAISFRIGQKERNGNYIKGFEKTANGSPIYFQLPDRTQRGYKVIREYSIEPHRYMNKTGYLLKWRMGAKKAHYHVFAYCGGNPFADMAEGGSPIPITRGIIERKISSVIEAYLSQPGLNYTNRKAYNEYYIDLKNFLNQKEEGYFPINCSRPSKSSLEVFYLSPAVFTKEVANESLGVYAGEFAPCKKEVCPACSLFGYVRKRNDIAASSKIRFSDLYVAMEMPEKCYYKTDKITLQPLSEPKIGNTEFYLDRSAGADFWTYDYEVSNGKLKLRKGSLRGRKYYWHHRTVKMDHSVKADKINRTIRPVKEGIVFNGKLFYESISEKQLKQLIWILNCGIENLGLKLGGAKPFGYGSIVCRVNKVKERCVGMKGNELTYEIQEKTFSPLSYEDAGFSDEVKKEFFKMAGLDTLPEDVKITYPRTSEQINMLLYKGFEWYEANHNNGKLVHDRTEMTISQLLPSVLNEDLTLKYNQKKTNYSKKALSQPNHSQIGRRWNKDAGRYNNKRYGKNTNH